MLLLVRASPELAAEAKRATAESNVYRQLFFVLTFLSIGMVTDFRKLWQEGMGRLAAVYSLSLFGFIIWIGLVISLLFFSGIKPPVVGPRNPEHVRIRFREGEQGRAAAAAREQAHRLEHWPWGRAVTRVADGDARPAARGLRVERLARLRRDHVVMSTTPIGRSSRAMSRWGVSRPVLASTRNTAMPALSGLVNG